MNLRIVVWNCNMALHMKFERLLSLNPDIAIIPECAEPDVIRRKSADFAFSDCEWAGLYPNKGLGVFSFGNLALRRHQSWERRNHIMLPLEIRGSIAANLLAVWAHNHRVPPSVNPEPGTTADGIRYYADFLRVTSSIVAGDFNANAIWDATNRYPKFAEVDQCLRALKLTSIYHAYTNNSLGKEAEPTLLFTKNPDKKYHIDYIYVPQKWLSRPYSVTVGTAKEWLMYSDHVPVLAEVNTTP
jgi:hypothetical protein